MAAAALPKMLATGALFRTDVNNARELVPAGKRGRRRSVDLVRRAHAARPLALVDGRGPIDVKGYSKTKRRVSFAKAQKPQRRLRLQRKNRPA